MQRCETPSFLKIKVQHVASFIKDDSIAPVSTLGDMTGVARNNDPR